MRCTAFRTAIPLATASLVLTGIGFAAPSMANEPNTSAGELVRYASATDALPSTAWARVRSIETGSGKTVVTLQVRGFTADATYGAHVHYKECGAATAPLAPGAHYQNVVDPAVLLAAAIPPVRDFETIASVDPAFANPDNEAWLDLITDNEGNGSAQTVVDWQFRGDAPVTRSVIIHRDHTSPGGTPPAGNAGPRLGCLSAAF
ncbi:MAG: superoxide dismutase [Sporichthyaceae bacterium]